MSKPEQTDSGRWRVSVRTATGRGALPALPARSTVGARRPATEDELAQSDRAAAHDGGAGLFHDDDGRKLYVEVGAG